MNNTDYSYQDFFESYGSTDLEEMFGSIADQVNTKEWFKIYLIDLLVIIT